jgi:cytochrome oxidase Cu insertion factor (SCO1/SenC/PrrC family)
MQPRNAVVSNYKIFSFVGFVCAAIIASLFIYRSNHMGKQALVNDGDTLVLPEGRDLKSLDLVTMNGDTFTGRNLQSHWTLMFFGFSHCNSVCPVTLDMISKAYPDLHKELPTLQVVFVSLDPERDTKAALKKYTQSYQQDFIGVSGKIENVRKLQGQLGIYSDIESGTKKAGDYQLQHTASIMLINPEGKWVGMFKYGMNGDAFKRSVVNAIKTSSNA